MIEIGMSQLELSSICQITLHLSGKGNQPLLPVLKMFGYKYSLAPKYHILKKIVLTEQLALKEKIQ